MMEERLNEYFSSLNFLCRNIISEKKNFESLLGQQWSTLPPNEQDALLNEHFIPPHVQQVYSGSEEGEEDIPDLYPRLRIKSGQKVVEDDEGEVWQDEHSGPFSWETSSQSEFSIEDDMSNTDAIKSRAKDPKRPKSPRLMKQTSGGGGDNSAPRPGALERTSSTDFQQLRHIWESHHASTPDSEVAPPFPSMSGSYLSRSQLSLTGDLVISRHTSSVENITEVANETEVDSSVNPSRLRDNPSIISLKSFNPEKDSEPITNRPLTLQLPASRQAVNAKKEAGAPLATKEVGAPLATKEDDADITSGMKEDVEKLEEIKDKIEKSMSSSKPVKPSANQAPEAMTATNQDRKAASQANQAVEAKGASQDEDILKKFGVTFSYGDEEPAPPANSEVMAATFNSQQTAPQKRAAGGNEKTGLSSEFDFLTSW